MRWMGVILALSLGCSNGNGGTDPSTGLDQTSFPETGQLETGSMDFGDTDTIANNQMALYESGTRIRARVGTTPDGAKMFLGWYDTELDINCRFRTLVGPIPRCYPLEAEIAQGWQYLDNDCTELSARFPDLDWGCDNVKPKFAVRGGPFNIVDWTHEFPDLDCPTDHEPEIYAIGAQVEPDSFYTFKQVGSQLVCTAVTNWDTTGQIFFAMKVEVSWDIFQSMEESIE